VLNRTKEDVTSLEQSTQALETRCTELDSANAVLARDNKAAQTKAIQIGADAKRLQVQLNEVEEDKVALETEMGGLAKKNRQMAKDSKVG
jgi:chromosome segregation ATPase